MTCSFASNAGGRRRAPAALKIVVALAAVLILAFAGAPCRAESAPTSTAQPLRKHRRHPRHKPAAAPTPNVLPQDVTIPNYQAGAIPFADGEQLTYEASWIGIPAANAQVEFHRSRKNPSLARVEVSVETNKFVDLFFKMRDYVRERFTAGSITPVQMYIRQSENKRFDEYTVDFDREKGMATAVKKNRHGNFTREFVGPNQFGILTGTVMALSQPLNPGDDLAFDVVTGSNRYVFGFHVDGRDRIRVPAGTFDALKITPRVIYMSEGKMRSEAREVTVWVSADKRHLPLRVQAAAFIGSVQANLVKIDGVGGNPAVSQR